jgi:murein DD-endopeptidase MepM/ murein hydrolase activator NlpD
MAERTRTGPGLLALAAMLLPAVAQADATEMASTGRVDATELPGWIQDLQAGRIELDRALAGAIELRDGVGRATVRLEAATGGAPRRGLSLLAELIGPTGGPGALLDALGEPPARLVARPVAGELSSAFGVRKDPLRKRRKQNHKGVDISADRNTPVHAAGPGVVVRARHERGYGRVVFVDHGDGLQTRYAHLQSIGVAVGQQVAAGQLVGKVGSTGRATGPHLHFEVRQGGAAVAPDQLAELPLFGAAPGLLDAALGPLVDRAERVVASEAIAIEHERPAPRVNKSKSSKSKDKARRKKGPERTRRSAQPRS